MSGATGIVLALFLSMQLMLMMVVGVNGDGDDYYIEPAKIIFLDRTYFANGIDNYLFRGNEPKTTDANGNDVFAYDLLISYLNNATIQKAGFLLPPNLYIIDIKLVYDSDPTQSGDIELEQNFFAANPNLGEEITHVVLGDASDPGELPDFYVDEQAPTLASWQDDDLPDYIASINALLNTPNDQPTVIYFHYECGCDRTGEIAASYAIKYLNYTYPQAIQWDDSIAGRDILPNHEFAVHWYCYYLQLVEEYDWLEC